MLKTKDWVGLDTQMSGMIWRRWSLWSGRNKYRTTLNGSLLSRRPRPSQNCSAIEEEEDRKSERKTIAVSVCCENDYLFK